MVESADWIAVVRAPKLRTFLGPYASSKKAPSMTVCSFV